jgi:hypothetical protein
MSEESRLQEQIIKILTENPSITGFNDGNDEADMARSELRSIAENAQAIADMISPDTELEAWVQSKITKAADYLSSVNDYMKGRQDVS